MKLIRGCVIFIIFIIWLPFKLLSLGRKKVRAYIEPSMFEGKPYLNCSIGNNGIEPVTVTQCQPKFNGQLVSVPSKDFGIRLPWILQRNESVGFSFDPNPLLTEAQEMGQKKFEVRAFFQDSLGRTYLSKSLTLNTDEKRFVRKFEMAHKPLPEPLNTIVRVVSILFFYLLILIFPEFEL